MLTSDGCNVCDFIDVILLLILNSFSQHFLSIANNQQVMAYKLTAYQREGIRLAIR